MIPCPVCEKQMKTIDSRDVESGTRRRKECDECGERLTTIELVVPQGVRITEEMVPISRNKVAVVNVFLESLKTIADGGVEI